MKEVQIYVWKIEKPQENIQSTALTLSILLATEKVQKSLPTGLKYFKLMRKLDEAITEISDRVDNEKELPETKYPYQFPYNFEDEIYSMIKTHLIDNVPAIFGRDKNLAQSLELLEIVKEVSPNKDDKQIKKKDK